MSKEDVAFYVTVFAVVYLFIGAMVNMCLDDNGNELYDDCFLIILILWPLYILILFIKEFTKEWSKFVKWIFDRKE